MFRIIAIIYLNNINKLLVVMDTRCVFFEVRNRILTFQMNFGFKLLNTMDSTEDWSLNDHKSFRLMSPSVSLNEFCWKTRIAPEYSRHYS